MGSPVAGPADDVSEAPDSPLPPLTEISDDDSDSDIETSADDEQRYNYDVEDRSPVREENEENVTYHPIVNGKSFACYCVATPLNSR